MVTTIVSCLSPIRSFRRMLLPAARIHGKQLRSGSSMICTCHFSTISTAQRACSCVTQALKCDSCAAQRSWSWQTHPRRAGRRVAGGEGEGRPARLPPGAVRPACGLVPHVAGRAARHLQLQSVEACAHVHSCLSTCARLLVQYQWLLAAASSTHDDKLRNGVDCVLLRS